MHRIAVREPVTARMADVGRQAERRRLAQTAVPGVQRAPARIRPPTKRWLGAISFDPGVRASWRDRGQPSRIGESCPLRGVMESPLRPDRLGSPQ